MSDSFKKEISDGLLWINQRALPITSLILIIAACYLFAFSQEEKIPLSMSTVAAILPSLFLRIALLLTLLISSIFSPVIIFSPFSKPGNTNDSNHTKYNDNQENSISWKIIIGWLISIIIIGILLILMAYNSERLSTAFQIISLILIIPISVSLFFMKFFTKYEISFRNWRKLPVEIIAYFSASMFCQLLLMCFTLLISYSFIKNSTQSIWALASYTALISMLIGLVQIVGAYVIFIISKRKTFSIVKTTWAYLGIIFLLGIHPTSGAWITGTVLETTTTGGRSCTILSLKNPDSKELESFRDPENPKQTKPLRIFIGDDGKYIARINDKSDSKRLEFIPFSIVTGIDECPKEKTTKNSPK